MRLASRPRPASWLALGACALVAACHDQTLLEKLDQRQANNTLAALQRRNIPARKISEGKTGYAIVVAPEDFTGAVDTLNALDLPPRPRVEIAQAFPSEAMVASPTAERARLLSLIEQRLEQTLVTIDSIDRASVHLSYPLDDAATTTRPIHIAVLIVHEPGVEEQELIAKVKRFMRNAVSNANYDDISVTLFPSAPPQLTPPVQTDPAPTGKRLWMALSLGMGACIGFIVLVVFGIRRAAAGLSHRPLAIRASIAADAHTGGVNPSSASPS